jgi:hypothetical protein
LDGDLLVAFRRGWLATVCSLDRNGGAVGWSKCSHSGGFRTLFRMPGIAESLELNKARNYSAFFRSSPKNITAPTLAWGGRKEQKTWLAKSYVVRSKHHKSLTKLDAARRDNMYE